jgi:hypothetical protein
MFVSLAGQALGAWPGRDCAGLCKTEGAWLGGDLKCLWISILKGSSHGDPAFLRGGSLGQQSPVGAKEQGQKIRGPMAACGAALWAYGAGLSEQRLLFFWYMVAWRGLPRARGSECLCFSSP